MIVEFARGAGGHVEGSDGNVTGTIDKRGIGAEDGRLLDAVVQTHGPDAVSYTHLTLPTKRIV